MNNRIVPSFVVFLAFVMFSFADAPWFFDPLGIPAMHEKGIKGKGVKVGVVDVGIQPVTVNGEVDLEIDHHAGATGRVSEHGVGVASIVKSKSFGIAPDCELYAYNGKGFPDDIDGIEWCFTNGCRVVNFSGGYTPFDYTPEQRETAVKRLKDMLGRGLILVLGGGNAPNETLTFPQDIEGVWNIAGITSEKKSAGLNDNWAKDFCTFGKDVPTFKSRTGEKYTNGGTSFAAPMATGIVALYLQQNPSLTRDELYEILKTTCEKFEKEKSKVYGWGLVKAAEVPAEHQTQAQIDRKRASYVKTRTAYLTNGNFSWDAVHSRYEVKMYPGQSLTIQSSVLPDNATDKTVYWYCGNMPTFNAVSRDNKLSVPAETQPGRFLVYTGRNAEREIIVELRVDVVEKGKETPSAKNVTGKLEFLFNPAAQTWTGTAPHLLDARRVTTLSNIDGRIYVGSGNYGDNLGPVPVNVIIPGDVPVWTNEYMAGTEHIDYYKKLSDGRVWTCATDPKEGSKTYGFFFCREEGGEWRRTDNIDPNPTLALSKEDTREGTFFTYTHLWDFCEYDGNLFFCGYSIGKSPYWLNGDVEMTNRMYSCVNNQTNLFHSFTYLKANWEEKRFDEVKHEELERFCSLLPFESGLTCWPYNFYVAKHLELNVPYFWRYDSKTGKFDQENTTWDAFMPGLTEEDTEFIGRNWQSFVYLRKPTPYKGRVIYAVTPGWSITLPVGCFSATMAQNGAISAIRIALGGGHDHPIDFSVVDDVLYTMTVRYNKNKSVSHGIWRSDDGLTFTKVAEFTSDQFFSAMTYAQGCFYVGCADKGFARGRTPLNCAEDKSGSIYRFRCEQGKVE